MTRQLGKAFQEKSKVDEGLPGVLGEQGSTVILAMGTREQMKKINREQGNMKYASEQGNKALRWLNIPRLYIFKNIRN